MFINLEVATLKSVPYQIYKPDMFHQNLLNCPNPRENLLTLVFVTITARADHEINIQRGINEKEYSLLKALMVAH